MDTNRQYGICASQLNRNGAMVGIAYLEDGFEETFNLAKCDDVDDYSFEELCDKAIERLKDAISKIKTLKKSDLPFNVSTQDAINCWEDYED